MTFLFLFSLSLSLFCCVCARVCVSVPVAAQAPFATSERSGLDFHVASELSDLESRLSDLLASKEAIQVALVRAARPGASFDVACLPPEYQTKVAAGGGARSRHDMLKEGEAALAEMNKTIHAHKLAIRKLQTRSIGGR